MKNNNTWLKVLVTALIALLSFAAGYGMLYGKVDRNCADIQKNEAQVKKINDAQIQQAADIKYIKETVDRIERKLP